MNIEYKINHPITVDQFIHILENSTLGERRPTDDRDCMKGMIENTNLMVTAWHDGTLIGVARSMTDFNYACYLSELAVDSTYQRKGIGKELLSITNKQLGEQCKLLLVSASAANEYYPKLGFEKNDRTWVLPRGKQLSS